MPLAALRNSSIRHAGDDALRSMLFTSCNGLTVILIGRVSLMNVGSAGVDRIVQVLLRTTRGVA